MQNSELANFWNDENKIKRAEERLKAEETKKKNNRERIFNYNSENETKSNYKPKWLIGMSLLQLIFGFILINGIITIEESNTLLEVINGILQTIPFILLNGLFWLYVLISIIKNDFKVQQNKIVWIILILFFPISWMIYLDLKEIQTI